MIARILAWVAGRKIMVAVAVAIALFVGGMYLRLQFVKADRDRAVAELALAKSANETQLVTINDLKTANAAWVAADALNKDAEQKLKDKADEAKRNADRARDELARLRKLDRGAPDCAALLDRTLVACPDLVRRLWPEGARPN